MRPTRRAALPAAVAALALTVTGCATDARTTGDGRTVIQYWMWDSTQMPGYNQCAEDFEADNPDIDVQIEQYGWDDYWTKLTAGMVAENAPDVFVDHSAQFGKFVSLGQILDLEPYIDEAGVDLDQYQEGLADLWIGPDGTGRYGLPKDWDTVGIYYNTELAEAAGYSAEDLWELEWNPDDGGTFEEFLAAMTIDENGVRGNEPGFDKDNVDVYGMGYNEAGGGYGQVQWSAYALSNDWTYADQNPWGTNFNYDDPRFVETIAWWRSLVEKGYMPSLAAATSGVGTTDALAAGGYASLIEGSWNARTIRELGGVETQVAPTPIGPSGQRASVFNGLSDAIWSGSPNPDEAWRWVEYLGSADCQDVMAESGVIFPAITTATDRAVEVYEEAGTDAAAFAVHVREGTTVTSPVSARWAELTSVMAPAMDSVLSFQAEPESLARANERVNALFGSEE